MHTRGEPPTIDLRANLRCDEGFLGFIAGGYMLSAALFSAVEVGIFDALEAGPMGVEALAQRLGASVTGVERIATAMLALGLLRRDPEGGYHNEPLASAALVRDSPSSIRSFLLYQHRHMYQLFADLSSAVRTGRPQIERLQGSAGASGPAYYHALVRDPEMLFLFLEAMNTAALGVGRTIARQVDLTSSRRLLDLGGGGGQMAFELVEACPELDVTIVEFEEACAFVSRLALDRGVSDRVHCVAGDFLTELPITPGSFDAVLLGGVIGDLGDDDHPKILSNARRSLQSGGMLLVSETLLYDDSTGPVLPALLSLVMLLGMEGRNRTAPELTALLEREGFERVRVHRNATLGVRDLVVAYAAGG